MARPIVQAHRTHSECPNDNLDLRPLSPRVIGFVHATLVSRLTPIVVTLPPN